MAEKLADVSDDAKVDSFVHEVAHLIRSQAAGIFGNLGAVIPVVLLAQAGAQLAFGAPLIDRPTARHVLESLTLLGPTAFYAAFSIGIPPATRQHIRASSLTLGPRFTLSCKT
jgi:site-specific recombinase